MGGERKTGENCAELIANKIDTLKAEGVNICCVITDSGSDFKKARKILTNKYGDIVFGPCLAHCLDLLAEDICELPFTADPLSKSDRIVNMIRNHDLLRKELKDHDGVLLKPGETRFMTNFISLQRVVVLRIPLRITMVSERADIYLQHLKKPADREKFKVVKADILSEQVWSEFQYVEKILLPLILFLRDNDGNCQLSDGNAIGHAYYNFFKLVEYYRDSTDLKAAHRKLLVKAVEDRWAFSRTPLHSVGFVLHPAYRNFQQDMNPDVMADFYLVLDKWVNEEDKGAVISQLCTYRQGRGMFSRAEAKALQNEPMNYWRMFAAETPQLQELALKLFNQSTNASVCEGNWSCFEYIFNKRRNLLSENRLARLVFIHGNLRNLSLSARLGRTKDVSHGSSLVKYLESL